MRRAPDQRIERLRRLCAALPEANERVSHGEPTWFVGKGKVFATFDDHHHGAAHLSIWLPQPIGAQEALIASDPARFFRPPYVGPSGWVGVVLDTRPDWEMVGRLVRDAYLTVAPPRLRALVLAAAGVGGPATGRPRAPEARSGAPAAPARPVRAAAPGAAPRRTGKTALKRPPRIAT